MNMALYPEGTAVGILCTSDRRTPKGNAREEGREDEATVGRQAWSLAVPTVRIERWSQPTTQESMAFASAKVARLEASLAKLGPDDSEERKALERHNCHHARKDETR